MLLSERRPSSAYSRNFPPGLGGGGETGLQRICFRVWEGGGEENAALYSIPVTERGNGTLFVLLKGYARCVSFFDKEGRRGMPLHPYRRGKGGGGKKAPTSISRKTR